MGQQAVNCKAISLHRGVPVHLLHETGWRWPPPPPIQQGTASEEEFQRLRMIRSLDQWLDVERVRAATHELVEVARRFRPHLIVSEMFTAAAGIAAERLGVPFVVAGWPAMQTQSPDPGDGPPRFRPRTGPGPGERLLSTFRRFRRQLGVGRAGRSALAPPSI